MQSRIVDEINRLVKSNADNYKQKYIPNLKREIRQNFITQVDFENAEIKIQETSKNVQNVK
jgi:hypothetical protein